MYYPLISTISVADIRHLTELLSFPVMRASEIYSRSTFQRDNTVLSILVSCLSHTCEPTSPHVHLHATIVLSTCYPVAGTVGGPGDI